MSNNQTTNKKHYVVYHTKNPLNMLSPDASHWLPDYEETEHFHAVADLMAESPEEVFVLTNNQGEGLWTSNPEVWSHADGDLRSTSVGDVIQEAHTPRAWLVLHQGFEELSYVFTLLWKQEEEYEENVEDWEGKEDSREDEVDEEDILGRIPCGWGHTLGKVLRQIRCLLLRTQ